MEKHKFKCGNPCGPCEWHVEKGVKFFAWYDVIYQAIFIIPAILQFRIHSKKNPIPDESSYSSDASSEKGESHAECYEELRYLAIAYSVTDVANLGIGILSDIFLWIGANQSSSITFKLVAAWFFFLSCIVRQLLHCSGIAIHLLRCDPSTYPYEFVVRLLCQYLLYGMWIVGEYIRWIQKGCQFVPYHGMMEPPTTEYKIEEINDKHTVGSVISSGGWMDSNNDQSNLVMSVTKRGSSDMEGDESYDKRQDRRSSTRKSKRKSRKYRGGGGSRGASEHEVNLVESHSDPFSSSTASLQQQQQHHEKLPFLPQVPTSPYPPPPPPGKRPT